ncbi:AraC family transcriptional regulator [Gordonia sp. TBRC 11910]|uniref:AraC family transcriptional regulator n=1 Tax=Gordonia asplenii TaxID=2725283 RepID=A0A848KWK4_9ACTN|nr:AraC family transcriptional regulator [Gordonia asplenii]NMO00551.1 AraC family transcriptional regulator [Gordonia asplenii]
MTDGSSSTSRWTHITIASTDRDDAVEQISAVFSPHRLDVVGAADDLDVRLRARHSDELTVAELSHGAEVVVHPGLLSTYYEINVPLVGTTVTRNGTIEVETSPTRAAILAPIAESHMLWSPGCVQLAVKVRRSVVDRALEAHLGAPPDEVVDFEVGFDVGSGAGRDWVRAVGLLRNAIDAGAPELVVRPLEELVVGQLLIAQRNNYSLRLTGAPRPVRPRSISRVIDLIDADYATPLTVAQMARTAGMSVRSLQAAFAEHLQTTPMEYVRRVRLGRAHQELLSASPGDGISVADVAFAHGFGHLSRFAAAYRAQYGESPSETLRR